MFKRIHCHRWMWLVASTLGVGVLISSAAFADQPIKRTFTEYRRDYDAAHLKRVKRQRVKSIVLRVDGQAPFSADDGLDITVVIRLRKSKAELYFWSECELDKNGLYICEGERDESGELRLRFFREKGSEAVVITIPKHSPAGFMQDQMDWEPDASGDVHPISAILKHGSADDNFHLYFVKP